MTQASTPALSRLYEAVRQRAAAAAVFGPIDVRPDPVGLVCAAANSAEPAEYRLSFDGKAVWASLVTANRWLSQSIEADLVHTGDKMEDLLDEELVELDYPGPRPLKIEHFRSDDKLFTFRSALPIELAAADSPQSIEIAARALLAYEACFRRLGDMDAAGEDE